jgi:hypothetical protein
VQATPTSGPHLSSTIDSSRITGALRIKIARSPLIGGNRVNSRVLVPTRLRGPRILFAQALTKIGYEHKDIRLIANGLRLLPKTTRELDSKVSSAIQLELPLGDRAKSLLQRASVLGASSSPVVMTQVSQGSRGDGPWQFGSASRSCEHIRPSASVRGVL